jgi:polyhydroxyalkanoate synthesis regulator phasin
LALRANTTGGSNSAFGNIALANNSMGSFNSAFGDNALLANISGGSNSAFGSAALRLNTGNNNSAFGFQALLSNTTGGSNSAFGHNALFNLTGGTNNIAIGDGAGSSLTGSEGNNIYLGNSGVAGESNVIRVGNSSHAATYLFGIQGAAVDMASAQPLYVDGNSKVGTFPTTSSRRYKEGIADLGAESDILMKLRPVTFYYKAEFDPGHNRQYGLVAEEVAEVARDLVVFGKDGLPQAVRYHFVNAMLLNEVQKQRQLLDEQQKENGEQRTTIAQQQTEIHELAARLAKLEALVAPLP